MFERESDMIPVLIDGLSSLYQAHYFTTEFKTGNGVADLVFTTGLSDESVMLNDYASMSLFVKHIIDKKHF